MTEYSVEAGLVAGRSPVASQEQLDWSGRHRFVWWWMRHVPDGLAVLGIVLVLLYLFGG
jgi:hypothetical protein